MRFLRTDVEGSAPVYAAPLLEECELNGKKWAPGDFVALVGDQLIAMGREEFLGRYRALNFTVPPVAAASSPPPPPEQLPAAAAIEVPAPPADTKEKIAADLEQLAARVRAL